MRSILRMLLTLVMDALVIAAVVVLARIVVLFFGHVAAMPLSRAVADLAHRLVVPFGFAPVPTPYAGVFDLDAAATVVAALGIEWLMGMLRRVVQP